LLIKTLSPPRIPVDDMVEAMRQVFSKADIDIDEGQREHLEIRVPGGSPRVDFRVGRCRLGEVTTDQQALFEHRDGAGDRDIVVYLVRTTDRPMNGCAAFPPGRPGAIVASGASLVTLAHEVGHVLGLAHVSDSRNLMTGGGTAKIVGEPMLTGAQIAVMQDSDYCATT
jgi:Matrixin